MPFPRGRLREGPSLCVFCRAAEGKLDPRPSMYDAVMQPERKLPKPPPPIHPLCPDRVTLDVFLGRMMGMFNSLYHAAAAVFQAVPAWLRFLESRRLDRRGRAAEGRERLASGPRGSRETLAELPGRSALAHQEQDWPADTAQGPRDPGPGPLRP